MSRESHKSVIRAMPAATASLLLVTSMALGSLILWIGVPIGWMWVGSQVQGSGGSIGKSLAVMGLGAAVSIVVVVKGLIVLNRAHMRVRETQGRELKGLSALEIILIVTASFALVAFAVWFIGFSGSSPVPLSPTGG